MTKHEGSPTISGGGASKPAQEDRHRDHGGITGNAGEKREMPSPADRDRGETSSDDDPAAIDLNAAHDRAS